MPPANGIPFHHQYPQSPYNGRLDPAVPHFTPNGTELARFKPPTPPFTNMDLTHSRHLTDLEHYIVETRTKHDEEIGRMQRLLEANTRRIEQAEETFARDLQTLQALIPVGPSKDKDQAMAVLRRGVTVLNPEDVRPEIMLKRFDRDVVAQVYLEQAEIAETTAKKLREEALALSGESTDGEKNAEEVGALSSPARPPHAPAGRSKAEKPSHAIEIKAPTTPDNDTEAETTLDPQEKKTTHTEINPFTYLPLAVRNMPPSPITSIPTTHTTTFTWDFLTSTLGGEKWSPSFYFISGKTSLLKSRGYWILEAEYEPFLPITPGSHGAKLTPFFNETITGEGGAAGPDEDNYLDTPVFVSKVGEAGYTYFGQYSQLRFSDKLDYERVIETVPENIRRYWAEQLASPLRPAWVTKALKEHFWPRPKYEGPIPTDSAVATPATAETGTSTASTVLEKRVSSSLAAYAERLKIWEKETNVSVSLLTAEGLMKSFGKADADCEPGLRLWWEYFERVGYEGRFYEWLVQEQEKFERRRVGGLVVAKGIGKVGSEVSGGKVVGGVAANGEKDDDAASGGEEPDSEEQIIDWEEDADGNFTAGFRPANPPKTATTPAPKPKTAQSQARSSTDASTIRPLVPRINTAITPPKPASSIPKTPATPKPSTSAPAPTQPSLKTGDLAAAKASHASATLAKSRTGGSGKTGAGGMYTPPHLRRSGGGGGAK